MSAENTGGPAFPESGLSGLPNGEFIYGQAGMTLRDYFAAKAMQASIIQNRLMGCAEEAYEIADAMLKARHDAPSNALLIAAAPDLLEAVQQLYTFNACRMTDEDIEQDPRMKRARAAIAKATGEQA